LFKPLPVCRNDQFEKRGIFHDALLKTMDARGILMASLLVPGQMEVQRCCCPIRQCSTCMLIGWWFVRQVHFGLFGKLIACTNWDDLTDADRQAATLLGLGKKSWDEAANECAKETNLSPAQRDANRSLAESAATGDVEQLQDRATCATVSPVARMKPKRESGLEVCLRYRHRCGMVPT
jgi:hypothetical protein